MGSISIPSLAFRRAHEQQAQLVEAADELERIERFDDNYVNDFITDFANSEGDAELWLENQGIHKTCIATADMLRYMAQRWITDPLRVYDAAGIFFWRAMKDLAYEVWSGK